MNCLEDIYFILTKIEFELGNKIDINSINLLSNNSNQSDLKRLFQDYFLIIQRFYQCDVQFTIKQFVTNR